MEIFAVTKTSVYSVSDKKDELGIPIIRKISLRGKSKVAVGARLGGGYLVGITRECIMLYNEDHPKPNSIQPPEIVNTAFHGGRTSPIVALFFDRKQAMGCFASENLQECDPRWRNQTEEVLKDIGDNHNMFIVSKWPPWAFIYTESDQNEKKA